VLALRGYLRLVRQADAPGARLEMLGQVRKIATTLEAKRMLLSGLADTADPAALEVAASFLDDRQVHAEAAVATLKIAKAILRTAPPAVRAAMKTLVERTKDPAVAKQAQALAARARRARRSVGSGTVPAHDSKRSQAMKADVAKRAPEGCTLVCYLNCGPDAADGAKGKPTLRHVTGQAYRWGGSDVRYGTIFFTGNEVLFEATGLSPRKSYQLGFSWWDYDHDTRAQSVWAAAGKTGKLRQLLGKTKLPSGAGGEKPAEKTLPIPRELTAGGTLRIVFRNEAEPNVVVSEIWLLESQADSPPAAPTGLKATPGPAPAAKERPAGAAKGDVPTPKDPKATNVLIVTGVDYPGHKWRKTTPVLVEEIRKDKRLGVYVVEDPHRLASPKLRHYKVIVHHWMNWKVPAPGKEAQENFRKFVHDGGGLVVLHFGCGAWQKWPEFVKIAGRVWNPKLRGHDPHRTFRVEITQTDHPITKGMKPFDITDELYTCLAGKTPITVLATARSKVDKKDYPMAFVLQYGKGRVFHSPLGHDVRAFRSPGAAELIRRACAWAAGLPPTPPKSAPKAE
jgi:type 1 glutamine amidotransferase